MKRYTLREIVLTPDDAAWISQALKMEIGYRAPELTEAEEFELLDLKAVFDRLAAGTKDWSIQWARKEPVKAKKKKGKNENQIDNERPGIG